MKNRPEWEDNQKEQNTQKLFELAKSRNPVAADIEYLISECGVNADAVDERGLIPLHWAIQNNCIENFKKLLEHTLNLEATTKLGDTALLLAVYEENNKAVDLLLKAGANKEAANQSGETALIWAAYNGNNKAVDLLLKAGANKEAATQLGETALIWAAYNGNNKAVDLLLKAGANKEAANQSGETALIWAAHEGKTEVVKLLLKAAANKDAVSQSGYTALIVAAREGHNEAVDLLLKAGANKDAANQLGQTALILAAYKGNNEAVDLLLKAGANKEATIQSEDTALILAARQGHNEAVKLLLDSGANIDCRNDGGYTSLYVASNSCNTELVKLLIKAGANPEITDNYNRLVAQDRPNYFNQDFLLPIFKEAIDEENTRVLVNLCKYNQYVEELSKENPLNENIIKEFIEFYSQYQALASSEDKIDGLRFMAARKLNIITFQKLPKGNKKIAASRLAFNIQDLNKEIADFVGWQKQWPTIPKLIEARKSKAASGGAALIEFGQGRSFVQDFYLSDHSSIFPVIKTLRSMMPLRVEWNNKPSEQKLLLTSSVDEADAQRSYGDTHKITIGFKALEALVDAANFAYEPTFAHANELFRDAVHISAMVTGVNNYVLAMSSGDVLNQVYQGEYAQALTQAGIVAGYMMLPTPIIFAYTGYKAVTNAYSFYSYYGTPEAELKSNIAYANLADKFGFQERAKEYLVAAMEIVEKDLESHHDYDSIIQNIAAESGLAGMLCKLDICN